MSAPEYLRVEDIMTALKCGKTKAYELIKLIGGARGVGMARVLKSKFLMYLEGDPDCASSHDEIATARARIGARGRSPVDGRGRARRGAAPSPPPGVTSPDGSASGPIPFTPRRKRRPSASSAGSS